MTVVLKHLGLHYCSPLEMLRRTSSLMASGPKQKTGAIRDTTARTVRVNVMSDEEKVVYEDDIKEIRVLESDNRGRINPGKAYANQTLKVAILEDNTSGDSDD